MFICSSLLITVSALIGLDLAENKALATLPLALQFIAIMMCSIPASLAMGRWGRRKGFIFAALVGIAGACLALVAIYQRSLAIYCTATACFGCFTAFGNYYRFTAPEIVPVDKKNVAISWVMAGGVVAAFIGPNLARWSQNLLDISIYAGAFLIVIGVCLMQLSDTAFVIQWHVVAMFAPSFVTGNLINRFGISRVLFAGAVLSLMCVLLNLTGQSLRHFTFALILLGLGWNFLFIGGTTLLTECYRENEKSRTQAANDFIVFSTVSITALSSGALHHYLGWSLVNICVLPFIIVCGYSALWLAKHPVGAYVPKSA